MQIRFLRLEISMVKYYTWSRLINASVKILGSLLIKYERTNIWIVCNIGKLMEYNRIPRRMNRREGKSSWNILN